MTAPESLRIGRTAKAAHDALDLATAGVTGDETPVMAHDGIDPEALDLVRALAALAGLLAGTLAATYSEDGGGAVSAREILEAIRADQDPRPDGAL